MPPLTNADRRLALVGLIVVAIVVLRLAGHEPPDGWYDFALEVLRLMSLRSDEG
jgi:hypothetical protein